MPSDAVEVALTAEQYRQLGRAAEGVRIVREGLAEHPDSPVLLSELASCLRSAGELAEAERAARAAVAAAPQWTQPMTVLALVLVQTSRLDEAAAVAATVIRMEPDSGGAWAVLGLCGAGKRRPQDRAIARDALHRAIAIDPQNADFRAFAAVVEQSFGETALARRLVEDGLALEPQSGRLLALRAEYAPVAEQPALLVDVLTANPGDDESRELLDAAVTWERRVALIPVVALPPLVAAARLGGEPVATLLVAVAALVAGVLLVRRARRRERVLPSGYRASRAAAAAPGAGAAAVLVLLTGALVVAGAVLSFAAPVVAGGVLAAAVLTGAGALLAVLPDDARVLAVSRRLRGRARGSAAARYGRLRNEAALWTALPVALLAVAAFFSAAPTDPRGAGLVALGAVVVLAVLLAESFVAGLNASRLFVLGFVTAYRGVLAGVLALVLLVAGASALAGGRFEAPRDRDAPGSTIEIPRFTRTPSFDLPTFSVPRFTVPSVSSP